MSEFTDARWYLPEFEDDRHTRISQIVNRVWEAQSYRREELLRYARLYGNLPILGLGPRAYARKTLRTGGGRLSFNVIRACVDTYAAKLTKEKPKVSFITSGGNWGLQEKAKKLEKFVDGQFYESDLYSIASRIVLDTAVFGTGFIKIYIDSHDEITPRIEIDRVLPWELLVDDEEAAYGEPRAIYQRKWIDKRVLASMYPDETENIMSAHRERSDTEDYGFDSTADQVLVTEAWHLRSGKDAEDGRHCIIIHNATLYDEEWAHPWLPIVPLRRQPPLVGYWGVGISEELMGIQFELNVLIDKIRRSQHLLGVAHILIQKGSVNGQKLDNNVGSFIEYTGTPPQVVAPQSVSGDIYGHLDRLYGKAFELSGISQQAAQSLKPAGIVSGEGLRVYSDISTERFTVNFREFQNWFLQIAHRVVDLAGDLAKEHPEFGVKAMGKASMARVVFNEAFLDKNDYIMQLYPTNALAKDPAARLEQIRSFADVGWIDATTAKRLLDFPDLEAESNYENASYNLVQDIIERLKDERYIAPESMMNLEDAIKWVQLAYLKHKHDTLDDDDQDKVERVLELFRRWTVDAANTLNPPPPPTPDPTAANDNGMPMDPNAVDPNAPPPDMAAMDPSMMGGPPMAPEGPQGVPGAPSEAMPPAGGGAPPGAPPMPVSGM